jgi:hypothetical protein
MTEFLARVGDRINPIVVKETRQAVNSRLVASFLILFLAVQLVVMLLVVTNRELGDADQLNARAGRELFTVVQGILLGTCLILIPTMTGARLGSERSDVNVDLLFISSLTPRGVLAGKLFAAAALALLIFSACAPFMTFAYVLRGLDVPTIAVVLLADYLTVLAATTFFLFLAAVPANRALRAALGFVGIVAVCYCGAGLLAYTSEFLRGQAVGVDLSSWEFWAGFAGLAALLAGLSGQFFVWGVAMISPPASNRMLGVRLYTCFVWLATGVGFGVVSAYFERPEPMAAWAYLACLQVVILLVSATSERDAWGPRVARRIPRSVPLRAAAFFFYTGSAGGFAFAVVGAALTVAATVAAYAAFPTHRRFGAEDEPARLVALVCAYVYCYCMTAVAVRRALVGPHFRVGYTWVVAALLFGLGCAVPYAGVYAFTDHYSRYRSSDELIGAYVTNPVVMIDDALRSGASSSVGLTVAVLAAWGGLATVVNLRWLVRQVAHFQPPGRGADA